MAGAASAGVLSITAKLVMIGGVRMKALTLYQPWATLVAIGAKKIETRSWATKHRGPLAIHAAKGMPKREMYWHEAFDKTLKAAGIKSVIDCPRGVVVATYNLVDCIEMTDEFLKMVSNQEYEFGHYDIGRYAWILENIEPLPEPIPAKGMQRLWGWEPPEGVVVNG